MDAPAAPDVESLYAALRSELHAYLCRLVVRPAIAEEALQTTFLRALEHRDRLPADADGQRAWLFKVASHLAFDALRRHANWRETTLFDLREAAESNPEFVAQSRALVGTPETRNIAREHLAACFACTLRNLAEKQAAALLLRETHGFTVDEIATLLDATPAQTKNWLQEARAFMKRRYARTCALIAKDGVCHQCVELDGFFRAGRGSPIPPDDTDLRTRLDRLAELRRQPWGRWHQLLFTLIDDLR